MADTIPKQCTVSDLAFNGFTMESFMVSYCLEIERNAWLINMVGKAHSKVRKCLLQLTHFYLNSNKYVVERAQGHLRQFLLLVHQFLHTNKLISILSALKLHLLKLPHVTALQTLVSGDDVWSLLLKMEQSTSLALTALKGRTSLHPGVPFLLQECKYRSLTCTKSFAVRTHL